MPPASRPFTPDWLAISIALAVVASLAISGAIIVATLLRRGLTIVLRGQSPRERLLLEGAVRFGRLTTLLVLFCVLAFPALDLAGVPVTVGLRSDQLWRWLVDTGLRIVVILVLAAILARVTGALAARAEYDLSAGTGLDALERRKRAQTIGSLVRRSLGVLIWTMAVLIILRELEVDITPVLTGAGIAGLAVGFGAQTLVRDIISGFFLIVEDQVRVGDVAVVNGTGGFVEQINLRTIVLRDLEGVVHVFPNGEVKTLANRTKDYSYYVIDLPMDYDSDSDDVVNAVRAAADGLMADPAYAPSILEPLEVLGVDAFGDSQVTLKFRMRTAPLKQWEVGRELRRRIKKVLDERGIQIPYPQLVVRVVEGSPKGKRQARDA